MAKINGKAVALNANRHLSNNRRDEVESTRKLASGKRVNNASDDAAVLGLSNKLNSQIRSKGQAVRNVNDAVGVVQTLEGSLSELNDMVVRLRELAVQSASDTVSNTERMLMGKEVTQTMAEINRIAQTSELFDQKLSIGNKKKLEIQIDIGHNKQDKFEIDLEEFSHTTAALGINDVDLNSQRHAQFALVKLDHALKEIGTSRAKMGAITKRFESTLGKLEMDIVITKRTKSKMEDTDYAHETAEQIRARIKQENQIAVLSQSNIDVSSALKLLK